MKEYADRLRREAYQNRTLNQELLDDSIVSEIAESCTCTSRQNTNDSLCLKSCLKTPPPTSSPKAQPTRKSKKKARRHSRASSRRFENETQGKVLHHFLLLLFIFFYTGYIYVTLNLSNWLKKTKT